MVNKFLNYLKFDGVVIFVNNHHKKEISFSHLLKLKNIDTICVYKTEPLYKVNQKKCFNGCRPPKKKRKRQKGLKIFK